MENKVLNLTNFQPESRDMAIFGESPCQKACIYIAITLKYLSNIDKIVFSDSSCHVLSKIYVSLDSKEVRNFT